MAFPTSDDPVVHSCRLTPPSPLPYHAWHGNRFINDHHEKVGASGDGHVSVPATGATATAPPACAPIL
jgi:hypothetical protein